MCLDRPGSTDGSAGLQGILTELKSANTATLPLCPIYHE